MKSPFQTQQQRTAAALEKVIVAHSSGLIDRHTCDIALATLRERKGYKRALRIIKDAIDASRSAVQERRNLTRRSVVLASVALLAFGSRAFASITDANGNALNTTGPFPAFSINVNGGTTQTLTITSVPTSAAPSSTVPIAFTFGGGTPSGLTAVWNPGSLAAAVTNFNVAGTATVATPASTGTFTLTITGTGGNTASGVAPNSTLIQSGPTGFPGTPTNPVGFAAAPGYPGSLTTFSGTLISGTSGAHKVYSFFDFNAGTSGTQINSLSFIDFIGCRFQSNSQPNYNVNVTNSGNITWTYCSFTPLASFATSPPGGAWPSAGAWPATPTVSFTNGVNCIAGTSGYQFAHNIASANGPITARYCDYWGFGQNGPGLFSTTAAILWDNCWIHDACNSSPNNYHTDGLGYQNNGVGPSNVSITNCTIASIGNTQAIAWQFATGGYNNMVMTGNYLSGYGYNSALGEVGGGIALTNSTFANNTFGTDIPWKFGPIYTNYTSMFHTPGNNWSGNKIHVVSGTSPWPGSAVAFTSANNGQFIWPDSTLHTTDFV